MSPTNQRNLNSAIEMGLLTPAAAARVAARLEELAKVTETAEHSEEQALEFHGLHAMLTAFGQIEEARRWANLPAVL